MTYTRSDRDIFLIGLSDFEPLTILNQLPTTRQVLQRFHHHLKDTRLVRNASHLTVEEVLFVWGRAAIPTVLKKHAIEKLEKIHDNWLKLKKNKTRLSETQQKNEACYTEQLDTLFDIASVNALDKNSPNPLQQTRIEEDRAFLADQRGCRKMFMSGKDKEMAAQQERVHHKQQKQLLRKQKEEKRQQQTIEGESGENETESCEASNKFEVLDEYEPSPSSTKKRTNKTEIGYHTTLFTTHVTSALDRNQTSDREALRLMIPIAAALGHDPSSLTVSRSTIQRARKKARCEQAADIKVSFKPDYPLVLHWDGKILPEILGLGEVDRLSVLVSGDGSEKLLGVPKLTSGTGQNAADAIYGQLEQWALVESIQAMSFDTTSVNTGRFNGACVLLENRIGRELLWLACRHHVLELVLAKAFSLCCGPSNSPNIPIFKRFKEVWGRIKLDSHSKLELPSSTDVFREKTVNFLTNFVDLKSQVRDDYEELIELTTIILGEPPKTIHWRAPGPVHHARWMAKLIYAIKICIFRHQREIFSLTSKEESKLKRFVQFGTLLYTKSWIQAPCAAEAPGGDLLLWKDLQQYQSVDHNISIAAQKILQNHMWYLSDETVSLALFSDEVSPIEKQKIITGFGIEPSERHVRGDPSLLQKEGVRLGHFSTRRSQNLLTKLHIGNSFLVLPPEQWNDNIDYQKGKQRINDLRVVNDTAERGVKLFEEYNRLLTKNEEEKQFILQVVEANRKIIPAQTTKKSAICAVSM